MSRFVITNVSVVTAAGALEPSVEVRKARVAGLGNHRPDGVPVIDGAGGMVIPGLINAHDHLHLNHLGRIKFRPSYGHAIEWIEDMEARLRTDSRLVAARDFPMTDQILVGVVKNLLSGVTTAFHHDPPPPPVPRRLPLRVPRRYGFCHSLDRGDPASSYRRARKDRPWIIHLAEGVDRRAEAELSRLDRLGALGANTVIVHGVGLTAGDRQKLLERGAGLVWCPSSNHFLLGRTAEVAGLAESGRLALGTDSRLTGEGDILAELRTARASGRLTEEQLFGLVTTGAARLLRVREGGRGHLQVGWPADLVLVPSGSKPAHPARLLELERSDLRLVMVGGRPVVADPDLEPVFSVTRTPAEPVTVDGVAKLLDGRLAARMRRSVLDEAGLTL